MKNVYDVQVLQRFVKDYKLPITIFEKDLFDYFLDLYDVTLNTHEKFNMLKNTLDKFESSQTFLDYYYELRDKIINDLNQKESYKKFTNFDMNFYSINEKIFPKSDVFKEHNIGKVFMSIDLVKANYQSLKYFDKDIVDNTATYEDFIKQYTDIDYFYKSKYLRQVIFGNINPSRQQVIEKYMTSQILNHLLEKELFSLEHVKMFSADEIVIEFSSELYNYNLKSYKNYSDSLTKMIKNLGFEVDIEIYYLDVIKSKSNSDKDKIYGYVKEFKNKKGVEFMSVSQVFKVQVLKHYYGLPIEENDLIFFHEGRRCKFLEPIF